MTRTKFHMERVYQNHVEVAPATASWVYQYEDPEYYTLRNKPLNHIGPMHYGEADHDHSPISYGIISVFLHPGGYMTNVHQSYGHGATSAANFLPCVSQFNYIQQPIFRTNLIWFQGDMPVANNSYNREPAAKNFGGQLFQASTVHNPELFNGSSLRVSYGDNRYAGYQSNIPSRRNYSHNEGHPFIESCLFHLSPANANFSAFSQDMVDSHSHPVYISRRDWIHINDGLSQATHRRPNLSQSNIFRIEQGCLRQFFPTPDDGILSEGANGDARYSNEDHYRGFQGSTAAPKPFGWGQAVLPIKNEVGSCKVGLSYTSGRKVSSEQNSSLQQHGCKNRIMTNPPKFSAVSSTLRALGSNNGAKQLGQQGKARCNKSTQSIRYPAPPFKIRNQKASAPSQVWQEKTKAQPSANQSKRSRKQKTPIHHITWYEGFDVPCEPIGQNCLLCKENLSNAPIDDEFEYYNVLDEPSRLSDVAVLPCGHAFHSQCLEIITPEEQSRDPPCCLCSSDKS